VFGAGPSIAYTLVGPAAPPLAEFAPLPSALLPVLPPVPTLPVLPPPISLDVPRLPVLVPPVPVSPGEPIVPAVPQLQPDNPVFTGLTELTRDVGSGNRVQTVTGTVVGTSVVATAGYVLLSPRLAYWLLSALLARRTVWKPFDPLEVVYAWERDGNSTGPDGDDDSLQGMVG
jgi:hypothetical protein